MKQDVKKAFEMIVESLKIPTHKTIKELIKRLEELEKIVAKSIKTTQAPPKTKAAAKKKEPIKTTPANKATPKKKTGVTKAKKAAPKVTSGKKSATEQVFDAIRKSSTGITVGALRKTTRLDSKQVSNVVFRLLKQGKIVKNGRGVYTIKK